MRKRRVISKITEIIKQEWHPVLNKNLKPECLALSSKKKVWFVCKAKNHEWETSFCNRSRRGSGCPFCSNRRVCLDNCLATKYPEIAKKWHPTLNKISPSEVIAGSSKRFWFICDKGHEYEAHLYKRIKGKSRCPYCSSKKICPDNCLQSKFPEVAKEWHKKLNGNITPKDVFASSDSKYWFKCAKKGHEYKASLHNRSKGNGCSVCSKRNRLENSLAIKSPEVSKQWHKTLNGKLTPKDIGAFSRKKIWFICKFNHFWRTTPSLRMRGANCPYCDNKKPSIENCLQTKFPEVAKQWHPSKNGKLTPRNIVSGSNKKVWFCCENGHEWESRLYSRTSIGSGCPYCSSFKSEEKVRKIFQDILKVKFKKVRPVFLEGLELDGACEKLKIAFEYDGEFHYRPHWRAKDPVASLKKVKERDKIKTKLCKLHGWILIRIHFSQKHRLEAKIRFELSKRNLLPKN